MKLLFDVLFDAQINLDNYLHPASFPTGKEKKIRLKADKEPACGQPHLEKGFIALTAHRQEAESSS